MIVILCVGLLAIIYLPLLIVYRLYFHPLAKIPGPLLGKITDWYAAWYAFKGTGHIKLWRAHQKYGTAIRYGPNSVSICSQRGLVDIYSAKANVRKDNSYVVMSLSGRTPNALSCIDKTLHAFRRKIMLHAFTDNALKEVQDRILPHIRSFCATLGTSPINEVGLDNVWGPSVDIAPLCDYLAFDVSSDLSYGRSLSMLENDRYRYVPKLTRMLNRRNATRMVQRQVSRSKLDRLLLASLINKIRDFYTWVQHQGRERILLGNNISTKDCFHYMFNAVDPKTGQGFTNEELCIEALLLVVAGSDTVSANLGAVLFHLAHNQQALQKATIEVRSCFRQVEEIRLGSQLKSCYYLYACISESMRISPSSSNLAPRRVLDGGIIADRYYMPDGTVIGAPIYSIHHNEEYFPKSFKYVPERWLKGQTTTEDYQKAQAAFCPFSIGPRSCMAKNLAWAELTLTIARVLFLYDIRLPPNHCQDEPGCCSSVPMDQSPEYKLRAWVVAAKEGPSLQFRARNITQESRDLS